MAKTRRLFSAEFKREAVQLATKPGNSIAQVAKDLELGESNLRSWVRQFGSGKWEAAPGKELKAASTQELERVKRELNRVKMERDILKKALATSPRIRREIRLCGPSPCGLAGSNDVSPARYFAQRI